MSKEHTHKRKHKVKAHRWHEGRLISNEFLFETIEEALEFCGGIGIGHTVKIYDEDDQLTHHIAGATDPKPTYA
jgi:hypothetical protein